MNKKIRIAFITNGIYPFIIGGMQKHSYYLIKQFLLKKVDLTLFHYVYNNDVSHQNIKKILFDELNVPVGSNLKIFTYNFHSIDYNFFGHYILKCYNFSKMVHQDLVKEKPFDFIYAKGFSSWYSLTHKNNLPPIGVQFHGLEMFQSSFTLNDRLVNTYLRIPTKINLKKADFIFSYGGKVKKILTDLKIPDSKIEIQYGGIESSNIIHENDISVNSSKKRFLFIGRNTRRKGYYELKKAIIKLSFNQKLEFGFIGPIEEKDKINKDWVKYYGEVKDEIDYYNIIDKYDVLIVPSISEGLPTVILECMARGLAIIATDVGAITDVVSSKNGIIIPPNNVDSIKVAIEEIINLGQKELLLKKKNSLYHVSNNFCWLDLSNKLIQFIKKVIK